MGEPLPAGSGKEYEAVLVTTCPLVSPLLGNWYWKLTVTLWPTPNVRLARLGKALPAVPAPGGLRLIELATNCPPDGQGSGSVTSRLVRVIPPVFVTTRV